MQHDEPTQYYNEWIPDTSLFLRVELALYVVYPK